jgi:hypothetical protein
MCLVYRVYVFLASGLEALRLSDGTYMHTHACIQTISMNELSIQKVLHKVLNLCDGEGHFFPSD